VTAVLEQAADDPRTLLVARLISELERLPASRAVALRLVQVLDDPQAGAVEAATVLRGDPVLTARVLRVANSVYYGLSGRVSTLSFAVTVVGFATVRSLAVVGAAGISGKDEVPPGFWRRSAAVAEASSLVARRSGGGTAEAFSTGLLHDLGSALLWRSDRQRYAKVLREAALPGRTLALAQQREFGATGAALGADVLRAWHFPEEICDAIARRHDVVDRAAPGLVRALQAGLVLCDLAEPYAAPIGPAGRAALAVAGIKPDQTTPLVSQVRAAASQLAGTLGG